MPLAGTMVKDFDAVAFGSDDEYPVGVVHGPVATRFGHHLILVHSRTPGSGGGGGDGSGSVGGDGGS